MKFRDTKIVLIDFYSYEIGALELYFEEMALKGWMVEKVSNLYIKFKKIEPKQIKFTIDVIDGVSKNKVADEKLALYHRKKLESLDWNYLCEFNKLQVFYKENKYKKSIISKREKEEIKALFEDSLSKLILRMVFIALVLSSQFVSIFRNRNIDYFADNLNLLNLAFTILFIIVYCIDLFKLIKFIVSINNEKLQSTKWIRFKNGIYNMIFLTAIIGFFTLTFENNKADFNIKIIIFSCLIGILLFGYFIDNKKDNFKRKVIKSCYIILAILIIILANNFVVSNIFKDTNNVIKNKEYSLTLKDFNDELLSEDSLVVEEDSSFLASKLFYYANGKNMRLSYELFESNYKWMVNWNFNRMMDWFKNHNNTYNEIKVNLPNEVKVYSNGKENNYIMLSSYKIIEIIGLDDENNKEEILNLVYNKVFNE